jgi:iron complex outermembrane recepter protein
MVNILKYTSITLLLLLVTSTHLFAQKIIEGTITGTNGEPVAGANVFVHQNRTGTVSAADGRYRLTVSGNLDLIAIEYSHLGYSSRLETVRLSGIGAGGVLVLDIVLRRSPLVLQEVVVSAGFAQEQDRIPYPIQTVMKKDLVKTGAINLSEAIARVPGVHFSSFGGGVGKPVIRGLTNANLILLNNGSKMENFNFSSNHPYLADEFAAQRIEVIKGPSSLQYGSDAVGGAVNMISEYPANPHTIHGDFMTHFKTNTNGVASSLGLRGSGRAFFWGLRGSIKSHDDYADGDGNTIHNTRFNEYNLSSHAGLRTSRGVFRVNYNFTRPKYGLLNRMSFSLFENRPELLKDGRENQVWYMNLTNHLFSFNGSFFLGKNALDVDAGYQMNERQGVGGMVNQELQALMIPVYASMQLNTLSYNVKLTVPSGSNRLITGVNGAFIGNEADDALPNNPLLDSEIDDFGVYAIGEFIPDPAFILSGGLRYDYRNMESFPVATAVTDRFKIENTYHSLTGSAGLTYNFSPGQFLKLNLSSGFRTPTMPELTQNGIHSARYERGDPDLSAQRNYQLDLNYQLQRSWLTIDVSPFYNLVGNYIYLVMSDEDAPIGEGKVFQHVQRDAVLYGGELSFYVKPSEWLGFIGTCSMVRAEIRDDPQGFAYPTFIPHDRLSAEVRFERRSLGMMQGPYFSVETMYFLEQDRTGQNETISPSYMLLNARIGTTLAAGRQVITVFINGNNLLNEVYIDHLSVTRPLGFTMIGRNVVFGVRMPVSFDLR